MDLNSYREVGPKHPKFYCGGPWVSILTGFCPNHIVKCNLSIWNILIEHLVSMEHFGYDNTHQYDDTHGYDVTLGDGSLVEMPLT